MSSLVFYGSLINRNEVTRMGLSPENALPVKVRGWKRSFSQKPRWRPSGEGRGVLTVGANEIFFINGVVISGIERDTVAVIDQREAGYYRTELEMSSLEPYPDFELPNPLGPVFIYAGRPEYMDRTLLPDAHYLNICLEGAEQWGNRFYQDFIASTYVGTMGLGSYLSSLEQGESGP